MLSSVVLSSVSGSCGCVGVTGFVGVTGLLGLGLLFEEFSVFGSVISSIGTVFSSKSTEASLSDSSSVFSSVSDSCVDFVICGSGPTCSYTGTLFVHATKSTDNTKIKADAM